MSLRNCDPVMSCNQYSNYRKLIRVKIVLGASNTGPTSNALSRRSLLTLLKRLQQPNYSAQPYRPNFQL